MKYIPEVKDAVVCVYNKDTSEMYWERILEDKSSGIRLLEDHKIVVSESDSPPERPSQATSHGCKYCKYCSRNVWCWDPSTDARFDP